MKGVKIRLTVRIASAVRYATIRVPCLDSACAASRFASSYAPSANSSAAAGCAGVIMRQMRTGSPPVQI